VLAVAAEQGRLTKAQITTIEAFLNDPAAWSAKHGGKE